MSNPRSQALLLIAGGSWNDALEQPPARERSRCRAKHRVVATLAEIMGAPVAVLLQVPEQPLFGGMVEDEIISYTFAEYMKSGDAEWPLLLPMVKSAVRGNGCDSGVRQGEWQLDVENFLVTGASKRGWTTWLTAAVDPRVNAHCADGDRHAQHAAAHGAARRIVRRLFRADCGLHR